MAKLGFKMAKLGSQIASMGPKWLIWGPKWPCRDLKIARKVFQMT